MDRIARIHDPRDPRNRIELVLRNEVAKIKFVSVYARVEVCFEVEKRRWVRDPDAKPFGVRCERYTVKKCKTYAGDYCDRSMYGDVDRIFEILGKVRELGTREWLEYVLSTCKYCDNIGVHTYQKLCRRHLLAYQVFDGARFFAGAKLWETNQGLVLELRHVSGSKKKTCECWIFEDGNGVCYVRWDIGSARFRNHGYPSTFCYLVTKIRNTLKEAMELGDDELGPYTYRVEEKRGWLTGDWCPGTQFDEEMLSVYSSF